MADGDRRQGDNKGKEDDRGDGAGGPGGEA